MNEVSFIIRAYLTDFQNLMGGLISMIKLFLESALVLNDICLNDLIMGFFKIGSRPMNRLA